jgi:RNA polymerase sigma-70 factor (ECF subfamily)
VISPRRFPMPRLAFGRARKDTDGPDDAVADRFRRLILPHLDAAYGYARYLTRDAAAAEDVVQDAFLRAFRAIDSCRDSEKSWLLAIVRNCHHDLARKNGRYRSADEIGAEPVDEETPFTQLERASGIEKIRNMVEALPEPFREAVVLRELEGLSYREIAAISGAPIGTVMSRLARGRQMLAAMLVGDGEVDDAGKGAISR